MEEPGPSPCLHIPHSSADLQGPRTQHKTLCPSAGSCTSCQISRRGPLPRGASQTELFELPLPPRSHHPQAQASCHPTKHLLSTLAWEVNSYLVLRSSPGRQGSSEGPWDGAAAPTLWPACQAWFYVIFSPSPQGVGYHAPYTRSQESEQASHLPGTGNQWQSQDPNAGLLLAVLSLPSLRLLYCGLGRALHIPTFTWG